MNDLRRWSEEDATAEELRLLDCGSAEEEV